MANHFRDNNVIYIAVSMSKLMRIIILHTGFLVVVYEAQKRAVSFLLHVIRDDGTIVR